jgi:MFS family permease
MIRRLGIIVGCSIACIGVLLQSLGFNAPMFLVGRLIIGFGTQLASGSAPLLITELVHPQHRPTYATAYNTMWYVGSTIAALVTYGTFQIPTAWSWRIPSIVQCLPSVLQLIFVWTVPESPRWLISKGREDKALETLAYAHAEGDVEDEFVRVEFEEIRNTIQLENQFKQNSWKELIATKGNRRRMLIVLSFGLFSQWSGNALVSYYLSEVLKQIGITYAGTILLISESHTLSKPFLISAPG